MTIAELSGKYGDAKKDGKRYVLIQEPCAYPSADSPKSFRAPALCLDALPCGCGVYSVYRLTWTPRQAWLEAKAAGETVDRAQACDWSAPDSAAATSSRYRLVDDSIF